MATSAPWVRRRSRSSRIGFSRPSWRGPATLARVGIGDLGGQARTDCVIHEAMAAPISSGLSSCTKWLPVTVTSRWLGQLRQNSTLRTVEDGAGFGVDEQLRHVGGWPASRRRRRRSRRRRRARPSIGIWRGQVRVGRRLSPGSVKGRRYSAISASVRGRMTEPGRTRSTNTFLVEHHLVSPPRSGNPGTRPWRPRATRPR